MNLVGCAYYAYPLQKKKVHIMHTDMGSRVILSPILLLIALVIYIKIYAKFIHDTETIP